jgi:UDP-N-acetylglucosamine 2-epimerase (non-hydrolysing)
MHLNPNVRKPISEVFKGEIFKNVFFIEPLDYMNFVVLMKHSYIILTDSGGIQEEGPFLKIPVLVMRENTERPEGIKFGTSVLVGTDTNKIIEEVSNLINNKEYYSSFSSKENPYGDGNASKKIASILSEIL